jgi:hypothetical protein
MFGFIMTRHVNSYITNKYWLECVKNIRTYYPDNKIIIIDDNSNYMFIDNEDTVLTNCTIIDSCYIGGAELLPYYYLYKYKFFDKAVIIHDSVFIQKKLNIDNTKKIQFLFDFEHHWDMVKKEISFIKLLNNNSELLQLYYQKHLWKGCFGVMSVINYEFLKLIIEKYNIFILFDYLKNRDDRSSVERVFSVICNCEDKTLIGNTSIYGNIHRYIDVGYTYDNYISDKNKIKHDIIKVWSGR